MKKTVGDNKCFLSTSGGMGCCKVESVISIDDRGQMVLPKETREKADIKSGDKLALVSWEKQGKICCMFLIKADDLASLAKDMLGPIMKEIMK
jgi:antitoxin PrlF